MIRNVISQLCTQTSRPQQTSRTYKPQIRHDPEAAALESSKPPRSMTGVVLRGHDNSPRKVQTNNAVLILVAVLRAKGFTSMLINTSASVRPVRHIPCNGLKLTRPLSAAKEASVGREKAASPAFGLPQSVQHSVPQRVARTRWTCRMLQQLSVIFWETASLRGQPVLQDRHFSELVCREFALTRGVPLAERSPLRTCRRRSDCRRTSFEGTRIGPV